MRNDFVNAWTFQSAPLTEARGDNLHNAIAAGRIGFNPLPSPKQGETKDSAGNPTIGYVSIRSPHRSKGRRSRRQCGD